MEAETGPQPDLVAENAELKRALDQAQMAYAMECVTRIALAERAARQLIASQERRS